MEKENFLTEVQTEKRILFSPLPQPKWIDSKFSYPLTFTMLPTIIIIKKYCMSSQRVQHKIQEHNDRTLKSKLRALTN